MPKQKTMRKVKPKVRHQPGSSHKDETVGRWPMADMNRALELWNANKTKKKEEQLTMTAISEIVKIPKSTITARLSGQ